MGMLSPSWLLAQEADLRIAKSADPLLVNPGAMVTWTMLAENLGPASINLARIADTLPNGIELLDLDTRCVVNQQNPSLVECLLPLAGGEVQTLVIRARVVAAPMGLPAVVNSATIADASGETSDPDSSNDSAIASSDFTEGPLPMDLIIAESFQLQENLSVSPPAVIVVIEQLAVSDGSNIIESLVLLVEENIVALDDMIPAPTLSILVTEPVSMTDSSVLDSALLVRVTENILLADSAYPLPSLQVRVQESVWVSDSAASLVPVSILVVENIILADQASTSVSMPEIIFTDGFECCTAVSESRIGES